MLSIITAKYADHNNDIILSDNAFNNFKLDLKNISKGNIVFIVDKIFLKKSFLKSFLYKNKNNTYFVSGGISSKDIQSVKKIINFLNSKNLTKDGHIVAIGGGVVCDIVSFVASIYQRGIKLILIPTTTTSMMDSCIGGKTGINYNNIVNLIGTYYHPIRIYIDLRFISSLADIDYRSGIAESIKKAIILDKSLFTYLYNNYHKINQRKIDEIFEMINKSIDIKLNITTNDTFEKSSRLLLNYGHTFGQAIESYFGINQKKMTHGYAVSLGMICASSMSDEIYNNNLYEIHLDILNKYNLPNKLKRIRNTESFLKNLIINLNNDKKRTVEGYKFILAKEIGLGEIKFINNKKFIKESFRKIL